MSRKTIKSKKNIRKKAKRYYTKTNYSRVESIQIIKQIILSMGYACLLLFVSFEITCGCTVTLIVLNIIWSSISYVLTKTYDWVIYPPMSFASAISRKIVNVTVFMIVNVTVFMFEVSKISFVSGIEFLIELPSKLLLLRHEEKDVVEFGLVEKIMIWIAVSVTLFALFQYGKCLLNMNRQTTDNTKARINQFINRYKFRIKCPLCNQMNCFNDNPIIYGLTEHCKVCLDNNVNVLLPGGKHAILCEECLDVLNYKN